jgi:hypothetical protein
MTAHICFKIGKYLNSPDYKQGIISIMEAVPEIEIINLTILFTDNLGVKADGLTLNEATLQIVNACKKVDGFPDEFKRQIVRDYLEANPEDSE